MAERRKQYYVLCAEQEEPGPPIALLDRGEREEGEALAIAVYTAPDGEVQQEHLDRFARANEGVPGPAFKAQIQEEFESLMRRRGASGWSSET